MKTRLATLLFLYFIFPAFSPAQTITQPINKWQFFYNKNMHWYKASVPGTIHTDLLFNRLIPDPYYRSNEDSLHWIDSTDWTYKTAFDLSTAISSKQQIELDLDGLDTYADVYLNGHLILQADNMFRTWNLNVKSLVKQKDNELKILFHSALNKVYAIAKSRLPFVLPDNPRVYARKAQYHFGWDWGPTFVTCGIWKKVNLVGWNGVRIKPTIPVPEPTVKLVQQKDALGSSFYFEKNGQPIYAKGANWIPADMFLPRVTRADYRKLLLSAKAANMNMLRVWGGGIYESDDFYDLCDSLGIMVWQDFMFAGAMVPGDDHFFNNVKAEVKCQVERLRTHPCIVLWCGNNEIDEGWNNWDWQEQFNIHGADSVKIINDYNRLFRDSLAQWVNELDGKRPYIPSSPLHGWGHEESYREGDSHYWGLWWGLENWEEFEHKTGRFVSEYGMQAMPNWSTIKTFTLPADRTLQSAVIKSHQKANEGFKKLDVYLTRYFIDSVKLSKLSLADYSYLTQCLQYYILKNSIAVHRSKFPSNMGTLLWQLNDCWPVTSWSITDYSRAPKAAWYAVREAYRDDRLPQKDSVYPKNLQLPKSQFRISINGDSIQITSSAYAKYIYVSDENEDAVFSNNYFDINAGESMVITVKNSEGKKISPGKLNIRSLADVLNDQ